MIFKKKEESVEEVVPVRMLSKWKYAWVAIVVIVLLGGVGITSLIAYGKSYDGKVLPGVHVGDVPIGGMTEVEVLDFLEQMSAKIGNDGIPVRFEGATTTRETTLYPIVVPNETIYELVEIDTTLETQRLLRYHKAGGALGTGIAALVSRTTKPSLDLTFVSVDMDRIMDEIRADFSDVEQEARPAGIEATYGVPSSTVAVRPAVTGVAFDRASVEEQIISSWKTLEIPKVVLATIVTTPTLQHGDIGDVTQLVDTVLSKGELTLTYTDPQTNRQLTWTLSPQRLADLLDLQQTEAGDVTIGISRALFDEYVDLNIIETIEVAAVDAKFDVDAAQKVTAFRGSRPGTTVDRDATYAAVNEAIQQRLWHDEGVMQSVAVHVETVEPEIKTGEVNDLGITEVLGVGYSNFSGSPANRVRNIRFAVTEKLHGLLIKPGETFSMIDALKPFTIEGGYLPELVIKGDEIVPEIGGGLCQVGSTMFRAAMNSGLGIVERRNHSLVVNYYNDPRNGLPGTDATIYEPAPDFKFQNNTGNYILITTEMSEATGDLWFTIWGTGDGRKGYYTQPVVEQWIPAGEPRITKTTKLAPGERKCQHAYPGAIASFTYVIEQPDGTVKEEVFRSHYRPLPEICLEGIDPESEADESENASTEEVSTETPLTQDDVSDDVIVE